MFSNMSLVVRSATYHPVHTTCLYLSNQCTIGLQVLFVLFTLLACYLIYYSSIIVIDKEAVLSVKSLPLPFYLPLV